jgi:hypothetical protein
MVKTNNKIIKTNIVSSKPIKHRKIMTKHAITCRKAAKAKKSYARAMAWYKDGGGRA